MTDAPCELGDEVPVRVIGVFCRADGDNKLVSVPAEREVYDIAGLSEKEIGDLHRLYPKIDKGEGWFGKEKAEQVISEFFSRKKRKIIITVQHTESEHHINGHIGAWGDWELTERGRQQAFEIGKWLLREDCHRGFVMYCSDLKRAAQTAQEISKTLCTAPTVTEQLREVNAGEGNGKPWEWFKENKRPEGAYDADYKPFPDAESDRELWNRISHFYRKIMESSEERILIVSHGTALSFLHSMLMGYELEDIARFRFHGSSGSVSKFVIEPNGKVTACYIGHRI